jgi:hypothetical protein
MYCKLLKLVFKEHNLKSIHNNDLSDYSKLSKVEISI